MYRSRRFRLCVVCVAFAGLLATNPVPAADNTQEQELLAVLESDAPAAEKAITCKRLAIYGSQNSVPALAKLLSDPQLSSWARIALEAIPGREADEALRRAVNELEGRQLVGVINSIGVRRVQDAVEALEEKLHDSDTSVAGAAALALGHIGTTQATGALSQELMRAENPLRSDVARALILAAEQRLADGDRQEAVRLYDEIRQADLPDQRILEATRGAILARGNAGLPLLVELLQSDQKRNFALGLTTTRALDAPQVTNALVTELQQAEPDRRVLLIHALADRNDPTARPAVLQAATRGPKEVRAAALQVLPRVGDASCVPALLLVAIGSDVELKQSARNALHALKGDEVDREISTRLADSEGRMREVLIELAGRRRIDTTKPLLLDAADDPDDQIRTAALAALGRIVSQRDVSVLINRVVNPKRAEDQDAAADALRYACVRMADREACAAQLVAAMAKAKVPEKRIVLEVLGDMGGKTALQSIASAAKQNNQDLQDTATQLLGRWMSPDAAPVLLDLAKSNDSKYQIRALRAYIRIARQFELPQRKREQMCQNALRIAQRPDEKALLLPILEKYPSKKMLEMATSLARIPQLKNDATRISLELVQKVSKSPSDYELVLEQVGLRGMKVVINHAEYGAGSNLKDVTDVLRRQVNDLPLVVLPNPSYNRTFGGDPAPGFPKQLKIQYTINGIKGQISLPENATIMLPNPTKLIYLSYLFLLSINAWPVSGREM